MVTVFALDERLGTLEEMIPHCRCVADIGADHGFLGTHLLITDKCERVQLLDVSEDSLRKARRLVGRLNLNDRVTFGIGDGAAALTEAPDCVVIAGMGGPTISGIVQRGKEAFGKCLLLMQPNMGADLLRKSLSECGFYICDERVVRAAGRWYVLLAARAGTVQYTPKELIVGPVLLKKRPSDLAGYAAFRLKVANKALAGALKGGDESAERLQYEADIWKEILDECNG